jgi:hypothetical protein
MSHFRAWLDQWQQDKTRRAADHIAGRVARSMPPCSSAANHFYCEERDKILLLTFIFFIDSSITFTQYVDIALK